MESGERERERGGGERERERGRERKWSGRRKLIKRKSDK